MEGRTRIIAISGMAGTGKSTLARTLSQYLDLPMFSAGQRMRELLAALENRGKRPDDFDAVVDEAARQFVLNHQSCVVEGRLVLLATEHFNGVFSLLLTCQAETRYRRIFEGRCAQDLTLSQVKFDTARRDRKDLERLSQKLPNPYDPGKYKLCLDTTALSAEEVFELVINQAGLQVPATTLVAR